MYIQGDVKRKRVKIEWDEGTTDISDGESSDEESDIDSDDNNEENNDGADERESEPDDGDEELGLIDNEELICDFSVAIHYSFAPLILFRVPYTLDLLP